MGWSNLHSCKASSVGPKVSIQSYIRESNLRKFNYTDSNKFTCVKDLKSPGCVLSCCKSCSYCSFTRASTRERSKSRSMSDQNKACQRCFLCKSMSFCPNCSQCPQCCRRTECRGKTSTVLAYLARNGCESSGGLSPEGRFPFKQRPLLTRFPVVQSGYANSTKSRFLKEALVSLTEKLVGEKVVVKSSLAFYNRLFLVPKPNKKWRPILDLSQLNLYLRTSSFKMETPYRKENG